MSDDVAAEVKLHKFIRPHRGAGGYVIPKSPGSTTSGRCSSGLPIPPKNLWIGYGSTVEDYIGSGDRHSAPMLRLLRESEFDPFAIGNKILDFGCGAGRMLRHFATHAEQCSFYGCDISGDHIIWAKQYLSPPFRFFTNTTIPHLPFRDGELDLIYCGSVFSHLDDLADTWFLELKRVLASDGRLYVTIHDESTVRTVGNSEQRLAKTMSEDPFFQKNKHDYEMLVISRGEWSQVFYDSSRLSERLRLLGFDVLKIEPRAYGYQTGIVLSH